jgi:hypothetical protein
MPSSGGYQPGHGSVSGSQRRCPWFGIWINLRRTKTIQFGQRTLRVPLPAIPASILCPVTALNRLFSAVDSGPEDFAFSYPGQTGGLQTLTHSQRAWIFLASGNEYELQLANLQLFVLL